MNSASARLLKVFTDEAATAPEVITRIRAWRKTLSLKAPRNWVAKNGPKRRCASSEKIPLLIATIPRWPAPPSASQLAMARTIHQMIIDQPRCLHEGIHDGGADKTKTQFLQIFADTL